MSDNRKRLISFEVPETLGAPKEKKGKALSKEPSKEIEMTDLSNTSLISNDPDENFRKRQESSSSRATTIKYQRRTMISVGGEEYLDTSKMSDNIKKIFQSIVIKTIEGELNENDLTKSIADTDRFIFPDGQDMENIFLNIRDTSKFNVLTYYASLINFFSFSFLMILLLMLATPRNNGYCFNPHHYSFESCDIVKTCNENELRNFSSVFFLSEFNGKQLYDSNELVELENVNNAFRESFYFNNLLEQSINNEKNSYNLLNSDKSKQSSLYDIMIYVKHNDMTNMWVAVRKFCNFTNIQIEIGIFCLFGFLFGNLFFSFLADIFGRKTVLILVMAIQLIGMIFMTLIFYSILSGEKFDIEQYLPKYLMNENNTNVLNYANSDNFTYNFYSPPYFSFYEEENLRSKFLSTFSDLTKEIDKNKNISNKFKNLQVFIYIAALLNCIGLSSIFNLTLTITFEMCVHEKDIFIFYFRYFFGVIMSYPFAYYLLYLTDSLPLSFAILSICDLLGLILAIFFLSESPRYYFEYSEYDKMTHILLKLCDHRDIKKLFKEIHNDDIQDEVEELNNVKKDSILKYGFFQQFITVLQERNSRKNKYNRHNAIYGNLSINQQQQIKISRFNILLNFPGFMSLLGTVQEFSRKMNLHMALICVTFLLHSLNLNNFNLVFNYTREYKYICIPIFFVVGLLSIYCFNLVMKFLGLKINFLVGFTGCLITTLISNILRFTYLNTYEDLDLEYHNSFKNVLKQRSYIMPTLLIIQNFFITGIYFTLYLYELQFTRTLYRCLFYGVIRALNDVIFILFIAFSLYINASMTYGILLSIIGILISGYLSSEGNNNYINDYHMVPKKLT